MLRLPISRGCAPFHWLGLMTSSIVAGARSTIVYRWCHTHNYDPTTVLGTFQMPEIKCASLIIPSVAPRQVLIPLLQFRCNPVQELHTSTHACSVMSNGLLLEALSQTSSR